MRPSAPPPVGVPLLGAKPGQAISRFFRGYVAFRGRASRSEFWWAFGMVVFIAAAYSTVSSIVVSLVGFVGNERDIELDLFALSETHPVVLVAYAFWPVYGLAFVLPVLALTWRRIQDTGNHGAFALLMLIPGISFVPVILCILPTNHHALNYGPGPVPPPPMPPRHF